MQFHLLLDQWTVELVLSSIIFLSLIWVRAGKDYLIISKGLHSLTNSSATYAIFLALYNFLALPLPARVEHVELSNDLGIGKRDIVIWLRGFWLPIASGLRTGVHPCFLLVNHPSFDNAHDLCFKLIVSQ